MGASICDSDVDVAAATWARCAWHSLAACAISASFLLGGCAAYAPKPLATKPDLAQEVPRLKLDLDRDSHGKRHAVSPRGPFDMTDIAILAVLNNPEVKTARDRAGIATAQAFAAGLLPDPQLSAAGDFPTNGDAANTNAFNLGLGLDIAGLVTHAAAASAAQAESRKADLDLLWQEWQVISRARLLFVQSVEQKAALGVLRDERKLFAMRYRRTAEALRQGNETLAKADEEFAALQGVDGEINNLERQISRNAHDLNALIGLAPDVKLDETHDIDLPSITRTQAEGAVKMLPRCRPDLLALKAGYQAQESRLRGAVLAQFPAIAIGITRARDTSNLYTSGFGITLSLPLFNGNRGNIAIARASRHALYDEFQVRLNTAYADIMRLLANRDLVQQQRNTVEQGLTRLREVNSNATRAYDAGNMDVLTYITLRGALLNKELEEIALKQSVYESDVGLLTLAGCGTGIQTGISE